MIGVANLNVINTRQFRELRQTAEGYKHTRNDLFQNKGTKCFTNKT